MKPRARVLYTHGGGRFGNQLLRFVHWLAWAHEHREHAEILDLAFWPHAPLFAHWSARPGCVFPERRSVVHGLARLRGALPARVLHHGEWRAQRWTARWAARLPGSDWIFLNDAAGEQCDLTDAAFLARAQRARRLVCSGWRFHCWPWLERHEATVRALAAPHAAFAATADSFLSGARERHDVLVGLLIRRGDYRDWCGGRFCFPVASYARWVRELVALHAPRRVGVVIAADEALPADTFAGLPVEWASGSVNAGGHWYESFLELAGCDVIASPPSTFAAMAAFCGDRPLWPLRVPDQPLVPEQVLPRHLFDAARDPDFSIAVR